MSDLRQADLRNKLLRRLMPEAFGRLRPHLTRTDLIFRGLLFRAGQSIETVTFPEGGHVSLLADTEEGRYEVGMSGPEGLLGVPVVLGVGTSAYDAMVQGEGDAWQVSAPVLQALMRDDAALREHLLRYVHTFVTQVAETAYANAGFQVEARLARWILMTHDRMGQDDLTLTHELLAMMLGTQRPGVTLAVQSLEGNRLIRATRGRITVLDRTGLEAVAGDAYGVAVSEYARTMGTPLPTGRP